MLYAQTATEAQNNGKSRIKHSLNQGWKFYLGEPDAEYFKSDFDDSGWETVHIPHSLELTSMSLNGVQDDKYQDTFMRKVGWYRKEIEVGADKGNKVFLEFEGVHQVTDVWVNGKHVGQHSVGGYTPFHFDISNFVTYGGNNTVTVLADNRKRTDIPPDPGPMDYIKFGGMYRDVYLVETSPVYIGFNWESDKSGQYITTPTVDPVNLNATINIKTWVKNDSEQDKQATLINRIVDKEGIVVLKLTQKKSIASGQSEEFNQIGSIEDDLRLWSIDHPYLYRVNTKVLIDGVLVDDIESKTGFRKIEINNHDGVVLNGKPIKLIGSNRHQHYGFIGDAMPNSLHYKDVLQLKEMGLNVLRTAHYPHDDAILEACDELGMLVYEEAPTWMSIGSDAWFDNLEKSARVMVRNHRNHTSLIIWGAGINHRGYVPRMHNVIKQEDPIRFTASQGSRWTGWQTSGLTDIYAQMTYGPYYWSGDEPVLAMEGGRGPKAVNEFMDNPMKLGLISWTAHAYYSFHGTDNPQDRTRSGFTTVFRYPKPGMMWYNSELKKEPFIHIESSWKSGVKQVEVYSNTDKVSLYLNDELIGTEEPSKSEGYQNLKHAPFFFNIDNFKKGTLKAVGISEGKDIISTEVKSEEAPYKIDLVLDTVGRSFVADGSDVLVAYARIVDKNGTVLKDEKRDISFGIKGPAHIVGDQEKIGSNPMYTEYGAAPVLIKAGVEAGEIQITAKSKGLKSGKAVTKTIPANFDLTKNKKPIYDFESIKVDLGEKLQLVQFGWIPWNGTDHESSDKQFDQLGGFTASISDAEDASDTRWLGEINVMGKYGFANGEGVLASSKDGLAITFTGLKKGSYRLTSVHHAPRTNTDSMDPNQEKMTTYEIYQIPYDTELIAEYTDSKGSHRLENIMVTEGKDMQTQEFGSSIIYFESDGVNPVRIVYKGAQEKAVWLNSFVLSEWHSIE